MILDREICGLCPRYLYRLYSTVFGLAVILFCCNQSHAEVDWLAKVPDSRAGMVGEPIFQGDAFIVEAGRRHSQTIVLVHGLGDEASNIWQGILPELSKSFHVLAFDLPGFGKSTKANQLYSPERYAEFIHSMVKRYVKGDFILVGHSMGGAIALRFAATYPQQVERLVLIDAAGILHKLAYTHFLSGLGIKLLPDIVPGQDSALKGIADIMFRQLSARTGSMDYAENAVLLNSWTRQKFLQADPTKIAAYALVQDDFSSLMRRVESPTLVIWGADDDIAPLRTGKLLAANIHGAILEVIDNAGHVPMRDQEKQFEQILYSYLWHTKDALAKAHSERKYAIGRIPSWHSRYTLRCEDRNGMLMEGTYDRVEISGCRDVVIRRLRTRQINIINSTVSIENSIITGSKVGINISNSKVSITGSEISAETAVQINNSQVDFAGATLKGKSAALRLADPAQYSAAASDNLPSTPVLFSVSRVESPRRSGTVHEVVKITTDNPL